MSHDDPKHQNHDPWPESYQDRVAWRTKQRAHEDLWKSDALAEVGLTGHPKAEKAMELAWSHREDGYTAVVGALWEFAELLLD